MRSEIAKSLSSIQDTWTQEERRERQEMATAMQLRLRALVVLSELSQTRGERKTDSLSLAVGS
ncbi:MAG: hypothetical protein AAF664_12205 [Planctomycetota bacterium]